MVDIYRRIVDTLEDRLEFPVAITGSVAYSGTRCTKERISDVDLIGLADSHYHQIVPHFPEFEKLLEELPEFDIIGINFKMFDIRITVNFLSTSTYHDLCTGSSRELSMYRDMSHKILQFPAYVPFYYATFSELKSGIYVIDRYQGGHRIIIPKCDEEDCFNPFHDQILTQKELVDNNNIFKNGRVVLTQRVIEIAKKQQKDPISLHAKNMHRWSPEFYKLMRRRYE